MRPSPPIRSESAGRYHATLASVLGTASGIVWIGDVPDDIADAGSPERCIEGMTFPGVMGSPTHAAVPPLAESAYYEVAVCNLVDLGVLAHVLPVVRAALRADGRLIIGLANVTTPKDPVSSLRSANLLPVPPTIDGIAAGLAEAIRRADDLERRVAGSRVAWSRSWTESFDAPLLERLGTFLADDEDQVG